MSSFYFRLIHSCFFHFYHYCCLVMLKRLSFQSFFISSSLYSMAYLFHIFASWFLIQQNLSFFSYSSACFVVGATHNFFFMSSACFCHHLILNSNHSKGQLSWSSFLTQNVLYTMHIALLNSLQKIDLIQLHPTLWGFRNSDLNQSSLLFDAVVITGDFNIHVNDTNDSNETRFISLLDHANFIQNI